MGKWKSPFGKRKKENDEEEEQEERPVEDDRDDEVSDRKQNRSRGDDDENEEEDENENDEEEEETKRELTPKKRRELAGYGTDDDMFIEGRKEFKMPISSRLYKETILTFLDESDIELQMNSKALSRFIKSLR